jgi:glycogen debranching enzyme
MNKAASTSQPAPAAQAPSELAQFFIPASISLQERRPRTLKYGDAFAVFDPNGDALAGPGSPEGFYAYDTRYLSHFYLTLEGTRPMLLSSTLRDDNATLTCDLTNPDLRDAGGTIILEHDLIHIRRSRFLWKDGCYERLLLRCFDTQPQRVRLRLAYASDFADLFEVRGTTRVRRGTIHPPKSWSDGVTLSYTGLDGVLRTTSLSFDPAPAACGPEAAVFDLTVEPGHPQPVFIAIRCGSASGGTGAGTGSGARRAFIVGARDARRALRAASAQAVSISTSNTLFNEALRRSRSDLYMLVTETDQGPYPYAGIPWFSTVFGRDALITALQTLWLDPSIARGVLGYLAANQATKTDPAADAEPGKILHEVRQGEMAELGEVPFRRYYGSIDSTPLFVMLAGAYLSRTDDVRTLQRIQPNIEAALQWMDKEGDRDGDGFIEYGRRQSTGLINQGWKDSHDSIFHADGTMAKAPIALVEVQAYAYGAWCAAAQIMRRLGETAEADRYEARAERLRQAFDKAFFDAELGTFVLALDGDKKPCRVRASNAGHALFTGIALPERAEAVGSTLMSDHFFSGWGVRTLGSEEARYNPMSYHNGSVWPHDNALIAAGLARYGFREHAARIFDGLFAASTYIDLRRLPELFCGFGRERSQGPTFYPVACSPQAWAAATPFLLLQSVLGLRFDCVRNSIVFRRPMLPAFLHEVCLRGLALGQSSADIMLKRSGGDVSVEVLGRTGTLGIDLE